MYASKDFTVLDPFMGSGTTAVACKHFGCDFIGIEKNSDYVEMARERVKEESSQKRIYSLVSNK